MTANSAPGDPQPAMSGDEARAAGPPPQGPTSDIYALAGRLTFASECADPRRRAFVAHQMDPLVAARAEESFGLACGSPAAVVLRDLPTQSAKELLARGATEFHNAARDHMVSAFDGHQMHLVRGGHVCSIPDPLHDRPAIIACEPRFPLEPLFGVLVRPVLQIALLGHGCVAVHAACVEIAGRAVLLAGWSETGKTEVALALAEQGAAFVSDKWTVLDDGGGASVFPIGVGIRRWVLRYLPRLADSLPARAQRQLRAAAIAAGAMGRATKHMASGRGSELFERALAMADRAALTPSELRAAYSQHDDPARSVPLGLLVLLTTAPADDVSVRSVSPEWAAARLARAAAYERRELYSLMQRRSYAEPLVEADSLGEAIAAERRLLEPLLREVPAIEVRAAFPGDPRTVAAAVTRWL